MKLQRWQLCNKHRKWVEKGFITVELVQIAPIRQRVLKFCKVRDCEERTRRYGFCERHSWEFKRGLLLEDGSTNPTPRKRIRYNKDFGCKVCHRTGKITKGLCRTHYNQLRRGLIHADGSDTGQRKRTFYPKGTTCDVPTCDKKPRGQGYCQKHLGQYLSGVIDGAGNRLVPFTRRNKGKKCSQCDQPAKVRLMCLSHYYRHFRKKRSSGKNDADNQVKGV